LWEKPTFDMKAITRTYLGQTVIGVNTTLFYYNMLLGGANMNEMTCNRVYGFRF